MRRVGSVYAPPGAPPVEAVVLVTPPGGSRRLKRPWKGHAFHVMLAKALFDARGAPVYSPRNVKQFVGGTDSCYSAGKLVGSLANKFAFPDEKLPGREGMPFPRSSDAYAAREAVFERAGGLPAMQQQITCVACPVRDHRALSGKSEREFRKMLSSVVEKTGFQLAVFQVRRWAPSFEAQIETVKNATVIIGLHGAGLTPGLFAPDGCSVIEMFPPGGNISITEQSAAFVQEPGNGGLESYRACVER